MKGSPPNAAIKSLRIVGVYFLNLLLSTIGPAVVESPFVRFLHFSDRTGAPFLKADLLTAVAAFGLGYFVYHRWQPRLSKWVWLAGLCWFCQGALLPLDGGGRIFWEMSWNRFVYDPTSFYSWTGYTIPFLRTIFYSVGALCCSRILAVDGAKKQRL